MFKMFAILCLVTVLDCRIMYENPPRHFDTMEQCEAAAAIKSAQTLELLEGSDYAHFETGCEAVQVDS